MVTCDTCDYRKAMTASTNIHLDWRNCWCNTCPYKRKKMKEEEGSNDEM